ncbi:MAG: diacylglycerol kinase [Candidatus Omnitrophota bacterium]
MKSRNIIESFNCAIEGFMYVLKTQRNMRIHFLLSVAIVLFGIWVNLSRIEIMILTLTASIVLVAEMINSSVEYLIDLVTDVYHPLARIIKDVCAGAVFLAAINAMIVGYLIFSKEFSQENFAGSIEKIRQSPVHLTFIIMIITLSLVITSKVMLGRGTPLRGGMPSGHSAFAFSIFVGVSYYFRDLLLSVLVGILALLVAQSRVRPGVHTVWEVIAGGILGAGVSLLILQVML